MAKKSPPIKEGKGWEGSSSSLPGCARFQIEEI